MRLILYLLLSIVLGAWHCTVPPPVAPVKIEFTNPVAYNEYIIEEQIKIIDQILEVNNAIERNAPGVQALLQKGLMTTDSSLKALNALPGFKGDTALKNRALSNFYFYKKLFTTAYPRILSINAKGNGITNTDYEELQNLQQAISKEEFALDQQLIAAQADFARRNKIPLLENEAQKRIDAIR